jgi:hypothetical protein
MDEKKFAISGIFLEPLQQHSYYILLHSAELFEETVLSQLLMLFGVHQL